MGEEQFWLWAEGDGVGWFSPWGTGSLEQRAVPTSLDLNKVADLRNGFNRQDIVEALAPRPDSPERAMAEALRKPLADGRCVRLQISRDLASDESDNDWTRIPFEWLRLDGKPLHGRLLVERYVPYATEGFGHNAGQAARQAVQPLAPLARGAVRVFMRLSDDDSKAFTDAFKPQGRLPRCDSFVLDDEPTSKAKFADPNLNLSEESALVLVCHGTETAGQTPFRLPDKSEWGIPHNLALPPLVVLLVCGSDAGNLLNYARDVLLRGQRAQTVIVSAGQLSIEAAAQFLRRFLEAWSSGKPVSTIVQEAQQEVGDAPEFPDARRLCVLGRGDLRVKPQPGVVPYAPPLDLLNDQELASHFREGGDSKVAAAALITLVNRTTLSCMLAGKMDYEAELRLRLGLGAGESLSAPLALCLHTAGARLADGSSSPGRLWKVSEGWVLRAHDPEVYKNRYGEYEAWRSRLEYFPPPGFPGRERPSFSEQDLPSPIAEAWEKINQAMDLQDAPDTADNIKKGFRIALRFIATIAAMDLLRSTGDTEQQRLDKGSLVGLLFSAKGGIDVGVWLDCLRIALQDQSAPRLLVEMRAVVFRASQSYTGLMDVLSNEYELWQEHQGNVHRVRTPELVAESLRWFARLQELLSQVNAAWQGWHFEDSLNHTRWHGIAPEGNVAGHEHHFEDEFSNLEMIHENGRRLDLSPLLSVQRCKTCQCGLVFFHERRNGATGAEYRELRKWHPKTRDHVPALFDFVSSLPHLLGALDNKDAERGKEEELAFRGIENFESPDYLFQKVKSGLNDLGDQFGAGYLHLIGPEGCGKSWFAKKFAEQEVLSECILRCRVGTMGRDSALGLIDHLSLQAQQQGLKGVDEARGKGLDEGGSPEQFSTFLRQLFIRNDLHRLTIVLDGLDELPEPEKPKPLDRTHRQRSSYRGSSDSDSSGRVGAEGFEIPLEPDDDLALDASALIEPVAPSVLDALPPAKKIPKSCFILLIGREAMGERATKVIARLRAEEAWVEQRVDPGSPENRQVVRQYVQKHLAKPALVDSVMDRSGGVFLWADHLTQALIEGAYREHDILPNAGEFYRDYLGRLRDRNNKKFESDYLPLMLLLAAAQESVGVQQLVHWGMREDELRSTLMQMRNFLSEQRSPLRFAIKHEGLHQYFKNDPEMATRLEKTHAEIVDSTLDRYSNRWGELDLANREEHYAVRFFAAHYAAAKDSRKADSAEIERGIDGLRSLAGKLRTRTPNDIAPRVLLAKTLGEWGDAVRGYKSCEQACSAYDASIKLWRALLDDGQLDVRNNLANTLSSQAVALLGTDRFEEAIVPFDEAIRLYRALISEGQLALRYDLAKVLVARADDLPVLNPVEKAIVSSEEAIVGYDEAIGWYRALIGEGQLAVRRDLAQGFFSRADTLAHIKRYDEAIVGYDKAFVLLQALIGEGQLALRYDLLNVLGARGSALVNLGRYDEAISVYDDAIVLFRTLVGDWRADRSCLVHLLDSQGRALAYLGRHDEAISVYDEVIGLHKAGLGEGRLTARLDLTRALREKVRALVNLGHHDKAISVYDEVIGLYQAVLGEGESRVRGMLANAFSNRGLSLVNLARRDEAILSYDEAITLGRALVDEGKLACRGELADALVNKGLALANLAHYDVAILSFDEAITLRRVLADEGQLAVRAKLAMALFNRGHALAKLVRHDEAILFYDEAITLLWVLVDEGQLEVRADLAMLLNCKAACKFFQISGEISVQ